MLIYELLLRERQRGSNRERLRERQRQKLWVLSFSLFSGLIMKISSSCLYILAKHTHSHTHTYTTQTYSLVGDFQFFPISINIMSYDV